MIKLKACLHSGGNVSAYVRSLAKNDNRPVNPAPFCTCGNETLEMVYKEVEVPHDLGAEDKVIVVEGVPMSECPVCGVTQLDTKLSAALDQVVDEMVTSSLSNHEEMNTTISFAQLVEV